MTVSAQRLQTPKGTRDFYPTDMAVRRHIERAWREVSINHGFDEIDGPMFEHLDLYKIKSGDEIVSELFSFRRADGDTDYALRPEFTPTLARMVAARAAQLPKPIKWFTIANMFRAERPQRGRLREHTQWNVDVVGDATPAADAEVIGAAVDVLDRLGLSPADVKVKISNRVYVGYLLRKCSVPESMIPDAFALLDRRMKMPPNEFEKQARTLSLDIETLDGFGARNLKEIVADVVQLPTVVSSDAEAALEHLLGLWELLETMGLEPWCASDHTIVRGLAYYTGNVFEIHEVSGRERAIAGGGRYDNLVELFGGPPTPACGIAMGDVVIKLVLEERGLLAQDAEYMPRPDVFVLSTGAEQAEAMIVPLVAALRRGGLHVRRSGRATRNVGKLLGDAAKARARFAAILGQELEDKQVVLKNLDTQEQSPVALNLLSETIRAAREYER